MARFLSDINPYINQKDLVGLILVIMSPGHSVSWELCPWSHEKSSDLLKNHESVHLFTFALLHYHPLDWIFEASIFETLR